MRFNQQFVSSVIPTATFMGKELQEFTGIALDSRQVKKGEVFVAIKGQKFDGHAFIHEAVQRGAAGLLINKEQKSCLDKLGADQLQQLFIALVPCTHAATIELATTWRSQFSIPVIGITGSAGKTSTKEMLSNIFTVHELPHCVSLANQNTALGVSVTILRITELHKAAIFEMGVSKRGEMGRMAAIVKPTTAVITSIGHCHMEGLGSLQDIANEKREIFKFFKEDNIGIINGDNAILPTISYTHPIVKFGYKTTNQVQARKVQANNTQTHFVMKLYKERLHIVLDTNHSGRINSALACSAVSYLLNIPSDIIVKGIQMPITIAGRFEKAKLKASKGILIDDCYNANPESMKAALLAFEKIESKGQKIAVLGDMAELGVNSPFWHRQLGRFLRKVPSLHHVVLVGDLVKWTKATVPVGISFEHVPSWLEATEALKKRLDREAVILVKGSNSMQLSRLVDELKEL